MHEPVLLILFPQPLCFLVIMGSGASKENPEAERLCKRAAPAALTLVDRSVTQTIRNSGLYKSDGAQRTPVTRLVELEVYLDPKRGFVKRHMEAWTLKLPGMHDLDLRPHVAYQLARLLWIAEASQRQLRGRFLLGMRDRNCPFVVLDPADPAGQPATIELRVNIMGDRVLNRLLLEADVACRLLAPRVAFALSGQRMTGERDRWPSMDFYDGAMAHLFRKTDIGGFWWAGDFAAPPELRDFTARDLPQKVREYYMELEASAVWRQYRRSVQEHATGTGAGPGAAAEAAPEPAPQAAAPDCSPPPAAPGATPYRSSVDPVLDWPVDPDPYDYTRPVPPAPTTAHSSARTVSFRLVDFPSDVDPVSAAYQPPLPLGPGDPWSSHAALDYYGGYSRSSLTPQHQTLAAHDPYPGRSVQGHTFAYAPYGLTRPGDLLIAANRGRTMFYPDHLP